MAKVADVGAGIDEKALNSVCPKQPRYLSKKRRTHFHHSSARALLKHAGTWAGNDLEQCLKDIYATRGEAEF